MMTWLALIDAIGCINPPACLQSAVLKVHFWNAPCPLPFKMNSGFLARLCLSWLSSSSLASCHRIRDRWWYSIILDLSQYYHRTGIRPISQRFTPIKLVARNGGVVSSKVEPGSDDQHCRRNIEFYFESRNVSGICLSS